MLGGPWDTRTTCAAPSSLAANARTGASGNLGANSLTARCSGGGASASRSSSTKRSTSHIWCAAKEEGRATSVRSLRWTLRACAPCCVVRAFTVVDASAALASSSPTVTSTLRSCKERHNNTAQRVVLCQFHICATHRVPVRYGTRTRLVAVHQVCDTRLVSSPPRHWSQPGCFHHCQGPVVAAEEERAHSLGTRLAGDSARPGVFQQVARRFHGVALPEIEAAPHSELSVHRDGRVRLEATQETVCLIKA
jgi:hypothetical protein